MVGFDLLVELFVSVLVTFIVIGSFSTFVIIVVLVGVFFLVPATVGCVRGISILAVPVPPE